MSDELMNGKVHSLLMENFYTRGAFYKISKKSWVEIRKTETASLFTPSKQVTSNLWGSLILLSIFAKYLNVEARTSKNKIYNWNDIQYMKTLQNFVHSFQNFYCLEFQLFHLIGNRFVAVAVNLPTIYQYLSIFLGFTKFKKYTWVNHIFERHNE